MLLLFVQLTFTICILYLDDPLVAFAFLQAFVEVLENYFGYVSVATLKDNFDTVYQVNISSD